MAPCDKLTHWFEAALRFALRRPAAGAAHDDPVVFWIGLARSALLVACVVHLFHWVLAPLEVPAFTLASNIAHRLAAAQQPAADSLARLALVEIDGPRFEREYQGTSPLDRCQLATDLGQLRASFKTVAVDLDLSPTQRRGEAETQCQAKLDAVLDQLGPRALLIHPLSGPEDSPWLGQRRESGVRFGSADLDVRYGMVRSYSAGSAGKPHFAELLGARLCAPGAGTSTPGHCAGFLKALQDVGAAHDEPESHSVIFSAKKRLHARGERVAIDSPCVRQGGADAACAAIEHVLVGGSYGEEDEFITPIGRRPGMEVQAAIAARPRHAQHPWLDLAIDLVVGTVFGWVLHALWGRYFCQRLGLPFADGRPVGDPRQAYGWLVALAGAYLLTLLVVALGVVLLFSGAGVWVSPAAMAVGMAIDGFVLGGVENAGHLLRKFRPTADAEAHAEPLPWTLFAALPCIAGLGIIAYVLLQIWRH